MRKTLLISLVAMNACNGPDSDTEAVGTPPDLYCPGDPSGSCSTNDGQLNAGAAIVSIVPTCFESWTDVDENYEYKASIDTFFDCGCDKLCDGDTGWTAPDSGEGDGVFQGTYMAGFGNGRAAVGVRGAGQGPRGEGDGLWARAVVLRDGETSVAIVALDVVGWFQDDVVATRQLLADQGVDIDHLVVSSTHTHQAPDTMGMWGPRAFQPGYKLEYQTQLRTAVVDVVKAAVATETPVHMVVGKVASSSYNTEKGSANVVGDTRDPWIVDDDVQAAQFIDANGATVGTLINWASHPETRASDNLYLTSDYVHALRQTVETGSVWESGGKPGVGGVAVYLNGAVGGMMTALHIDITDPDGHTWSEASWEKVDANGQLVGEMALDALASGERVDNPDVSFRAQWLHLPIDNIGFQAMFLADVMVRQTYDWDPTLPVSDTNQPQIETEVDVVNIGPLQLLTLPGEVLPELAVGGYDGSHTPPSATLLDPNNPNPPDLTAAPPAPYFKDKMTGEYRFIVGLGNDEIGYILPPYDFKVDDTSPWLTEPDGDHYEETNSLGAQTAPLLDTALSGLLAWTP